MKSVTESNTIHNLIKGISHQDKNLKRNNNFVLPHFVVLFQHYSDHSLNSTSAVTISESSNFSQIQILFSSFIFIHSNGHWISLKFTIKYAIVYAFIYECTCNNKQAILIIYHNTFCHVVLITIPQCNGSNHHPFPISKTKALCRYYFE